MTDRQKMLALVRSMPGAMKREWFRDLAEWDATSVDEYAVSGAATDSDVQYCGFFLQVWSDATGREWGWKCPRFSLRQFCGRMDAEDRAAVAAWVQNPFLP